MLSSGYRAVALLPVIPVLCLHYSNGKMVMDWVQPWGKSTLDDQESFHLLPNRKYSASLNSLAAGRSTVNTLNNYQSEQSISKMGDLIAAYLSAKNSFHDLCLHEIYASPHEADWLCEWFHPSLYHLPRKTAGWCAKVLKGLQYFQSYHGRKQLKSNPKVMLVSPETTGETVAKLNVNFL